MYIFTKVRIYVYNGPKWLKPHAVVEIWSIYFKEVIFVWLDELDNLDYDIHAWIRIHIQSHISAENIVLNVLSG